MTQSGRRALKLIPTKLEESQYYSSALGRGLQEDKQKVTKKRVNDANGATEIAQLVLL